MSKPDDYQHNNLEAGVSRYGGAGKSKPSTKTLVDVTENMEATLYATHVFLASANLTLPSDPKKGDWVGFSNRSGTTTPAILRNGKRIMGLEEDLTLDQVDSRGVLSYLNESQGWVLTSN